MGEAQMSYELPAGVVVDIDGPVRIVRFDRPEKLNAVSESVHDALALVWRLIAKDPDARAVVLTGPGEAFSAGGDMDLIESMISDERIRARVLEQSAEIVRDMLSFRLPVVAAVNGPALGLGCTLALLCDVVFIEEGASLADPHVPIGLVAGDGSVVVWPFATSMLAAKEFLLTGDPISAQDAYRLGLSNHVTEGGSCLSEAVAFAHRLAGMPKDAVQGTKRALNMHMERAAVGVFEYALDAEYRTCGTDEHQKRVERFKSRQARKR